MSTSELPREGSIVYNIRHGDEKAKRKTLRKWKLINKYIVVPLARLRLLPLFGLKNTFIVISVIGRKSGKIRRAGVQLRIVDDLKYIFLARGMKTQWYLNHKANPDQTKIYYGFHKRDADFRQLTQDEKVETMREYVKQHPKWANLGIGWREEDDLHGEILVTYVKGIEILEIKFKDE